VSLHHPAHPDHPVFHPGHGEGIVGIQKLVIGDDLQAPGRAHKVDEGRSGGKRCGSEAELHRQGREGGPAAEGGAEAAHHPVLVGRDHAERQPPGGTAQGLHGLDQEAPGELGFIDHLIGFGQKDITGPEHGGGQLAIALRIGAGLGKEQIKDDEAGAGGPKALHQGGVQLTGPWPGEVDLLEGGLVDGHDEEAFRGRPMRPQAVGRIQRLIFQSPARGEETEEAHQEEGHPAAEEGAAAGAAETGGRRGHGGPWPPSPGWSGRGAGR
jgi:hypothetical protein